MRRPCRLGKVTIAVVMLVVELALLFVGRLAGSGADGVETGAGMAVRHRWEPYLTNVVQLLLTRVGASFSLPGNRKEKTQNADNSSLLTPEYIIQEFHVVLLGGEPYFWLNKLRLSLQFFIFKILLLTVLSMFICHLYHKLSLNLLSPDKL